MIYSFSYPYDLFLFIRFSRKKYYGMNTKSSSRMRYIQTTSWLYARPLRTDIISIIKTSNERSVDKLWIYKFDEETWWRNLIETTHPQKRVENMQKLN